MYVCHAHTSVHTHVHIQKSPRTLVWNTDSLGSTPLCLPLQSLAGCTLGRKIMANPSSKCLKSRIPVSLLKGEPPEVPAAGGPRKAPMETSFLKADVCSCSHRITSALCLTMSYVK